MRTHSEKWSIILLISLSITFTGLAQQPKIDSLKYALEKANEDSGKVNILNVVSKELLLIGAYEQARKYSIDAIALSEKVNFKQGKASAYITIGVVNMQQANYLEALENYSLALVIRKEIKDKRGIAVCYNNIGNVYHALGNYREEIKCHLSAMKIRLEINDKQGIAASYNNLGNVYDKQGDYAKALNNYYAALKINKELGAKGRVANNYNNIGVIYARQRNYSEAVKNFRSALEIREELQDNPGIRFSLNNLGNIFQVTGKLSEALENYRASLKINTELGDKSGVADCYGSIGNVYKMQGDYSNASRNYFASLKIHQEIGNKEGVANIYGQLGELSILQGNFLQAKKYLNDKLLISQELGSKDNLKSSYLYLAKLDSAEGNYREAFENQKLYMFWKDSLLNENNNLLIAQMKEEYETEIKSDSIRDALDSLDIYKSNEEVQKLEIEKEQRHNAFLWKLGGVSILVVSIGSYQYYRRRRHQEREELRIMFQADLHEELGNEITTIQRSCDIIETKIQTEDAAVNSAINILRERSNSIYDSFRDTLRAVNPKPLRLEELCTSLNSIAATLEKLSVKIEKDIVCDNPTTQISSLQAMDFTRAIKEIVSNITKHSQAQFVKFQVHFKGKNYDLEIQDDGNGFDPALVAGKGNGLTNIQKRINRINGLVEINSNEGAGTRIHIRGIFS